MVASISAMLETITFVHLVSFRIAPLISLIVGVELVGVVVHACVVSIIVWIHAVTAIIVGGSTHLNSPILKLMSGNNCLNNLMAEKTQGCLWYISRWIGIRLTAKSKPCIAPTKLLPWWVVAATTAGRATCFTGSVFEFREHCFLLVPRNFG
jgi:hypothetical protein